MRHWHWHTITRVPEVICAGKQWDKWQLCTSWEVQQGKYAYYLMVGHFYYETATKEIKAKPLIDKCIISKCGFMLMHDFTIMH